MQKICIIEVIHINFQVKQMFVKGNLFGSVVIEFVSTLRAPFNLFTYSRNPFGQSDHFDIKLYLF